MTATTTKINELRLNMNNDIHIIATVTTKTEMRNFRNGTGKLFEIGMHDDSSSIKMVFFNAHAEKFYANIQEGKTYEINGFKVVAANRMFNPNHIYQLQSTENTCFVENNTEKFEFKGKIYQL